ncbi:MAG: hypothetical protein CMJ58_13045 [Planctomycetaceae bacterium]|nr:hypothetical protein [Planctomycetaceae bacterium]
MSAVRLRRLAADFARLDDYVRRHPRLRMVQTHGDPSERYQIEYQIRSVRMVAGEVHETRTHLVEITLPLHYPRLPPQCRMLTPVFHPNIAPHAICIGDHWTAGESLQSIVMRIGEMLAYQSYNVKSPLNGEAAHWVEKNRDRLPLDRVSMLVEEDPVRASAESTPAESAPPRPATGADSAASRAKALHVRCPHCDKAYRVSAEYSGRRFRCTGCQQAFQVD